MNKTILIAPFESAAARALAEEARNSGWTAVLARSSAQAARSEPGAESAGTTILAWNPPSYISASALLLGAKNAVGELDAAIILEEPAAAKVDLLASAPGAIETALSASCLGPALLSRELVRYFEARKSGSLLLFAVEAPGETPRGPAAALAAEAFRGLGEGLFAQGRAASWQAFGLQDASGLELESARFALRLLDEGKSGKSGRWLRFTGKPGIFGMF